MLFRSVLVLAAVIGVPRRQPRFAVTLTEDHDVVFLPAVRLEEFVKCAIGRILIEKLLVQHCTAVVRKEFARSGDERESVHANRSFA